MEQEGREAADPKQAARHLPGIALRAALVALLALAIGDMAGQRGWAAVSWACFALCGIAGIGACAAAALALPHLENPLARATAWIAAAIGLGSLAVLAGQIV